MPAEIRLKLEEPKAVKPKFCTELNCNTVGSQFILYCILNILSNSCPLIATHTTSPTLPVSVEPKIAKPDAGGSHVSPPPPVVPPPVVPPPVVPPPSGGPTVAGQFAKSDKNIPVLLAISVGTGLLEKLTVWVPDANT